MSGSALPRIGAALLVCALVGLPGFAAPQETALAGTRVPVLTAISASHHRSYDQVVFTFAGEVPRHRTARYVSQVPGGTTAPEIAGRARLLITFLRTSAKGSNGLPTYGPAARTYALPGVIQVVTVRLYRKEVSLAVGVARHEPFRMVVLAHDRLAINVRTPYRTVQASDFFIKSHSGPGIPTTEAVARPVSAKAAASDALQRLFAGPTQDELASGLRLVTSGATGFEQLSVRGGVARLQLKGGCNSGGSTVSVATEIMPTLRQFSTVQWVKIYDPAGHTEQAVGNTDSIPACLKPSTVKVFTAKLRGPALAALVVLAGPGILLGVVLSALSVLAGLVLRPRLITPAAYRAERVKARPVGKGQFEPDLAWPFYALRQVRADLAAIEAQRQARYGKLWKWPVKPMVWILLLPVTVIVVTCLLIAGLTTVVLAILFALVIWVCAGIAVALFTTGALLLRGAEGVWHKVLGAEASCPNCYHVTPRPAYRCRGCQELHRDLRPGRFGLFTRRCRCGTLLPTTALGAAWRLTAVCQRCKKPLRAGAGAVRDVRIPIFGDTSVGKTRFLYAGLDSLVETTNRARIEFGFPDEDSANQAALALDVIRSGQDTAKTSSTLPTALTCQIGKGTRRTLVHLFDAAGEFYRGAEMQDSLGFLDHGHGLVYVLDPFSIGPVRDLLAASAIRDAHAAAGDPETAYGEVVSRLRDSGVEAKGQRLAVVVSKTDLLGIGGLVLPEHSDAISDWLMEMGVHNLVLSARREFAEVRYFAVASIAAPLATRRPRDPGAPLRWLLAARGLKLPGDPDTLRATHGTRSRTQDEDHGRSGADCGETTRAER
jgi:hypothetical protein